MDKGKIRVAPGPPVLWIYPLSILVIPECFVYLPVAIYNNGSIIMCGISPVYLSVLQSFYAKGHWSYLFLRAPDCFVMPLS